MNWVYGKKYIVTDDMEGAYDDNVFEKGDIVCFTEEDSTNPQYARAIINDEVVALICISWINTDLLEEFKTKG